MFHQRTETNEVVFVDLIEKKREETENSKRRKEKIVNLVFPLEKAYPLVHIHRIHKHQVPLKGERSSFFKLLKYFSLFV